jgi:hypothetical protein
MYELKKAVSVRHADNQLPSMSIACNLHALAAGLVALHDSKFVFDFCGGM